MSEESTRVTDRHFHYLAQRTSQEDAFLNELKAAARDEGIRPIWISPEQASLMQILLRLHRAHDVVEVGTLAGYSAIIMARALLPGGKVRTVEKEDKHADFAERWIAKSDVADRVKVFRGKGADVLPTFEADSADAAFIDADKEGYARYLDECLRIVRSGGLIMVDNAFAFGRLFSHDPDDSGVQAIREFNDYMASRPGLDSIIVPIGDGCWVGVKR